MDKLEKDTSKDTSLLRIDKNIAQNSFNFSQYGSEENLIRDFVIYMCKVYQSRQDLFGYTIADPKKFAKEMNIKSPNFLFAHAEEPAQAKKEGQKKFTQLLERSPQKAFATRFENALYRMFTEPLILPEVGVTKEGNQYVQLDKIDLIKSVRIVIDKKNRNKKYYEVIPGEHLINNLSVFYTFMDPKVYVSLNNRLKSFYLFLCNVKYNLIYQKGQSFDYTFDSICRKLNINSGEPKEKKKRINNSFKEIIKVDPNLGINMTWGRAGKWDYKPEFSLDNTLIQNESIPVRKDVKNDIFTNEYLIGIYEDFKRTFYKDLDADSEDFISANGKIRTHFKLWLNDPDQGVVFKRDNYIKASQKAWGEKFEIIEYQIQKFIATARFEDL